MKIISLMVAGDSNFGLLCNIQTKIDWINGRFEGVKIEHILGSYEGSTTALIVFSYEDLREEPIAKPS